jgi:hypothetical protein
MARLNAASSDRSERANLSATDLPGSACQQQRAENPCVALRSNHLSRYTYGVQGGRVDVGAAEQWYLEV